MSALAFGKPMTALLRELRAEVIDTDEAQKQWILRSLSPILESAGPKKRILLRVTEA